MSKSMAVAIIFLLSSLDPDMVTGLRLNGIEYSTQRKAYIEEAAYRNGIRYENDIFLCIVLFVLFLIRWPLLPNAVRPF